MAYPNGKYPLSLNDPRWKEVNSPERTELFKKQLNERGFADPDRWDMCD